MKVVPVLILESWVQRERDVLSTCSYVGALAEAREHEEVRIEVVRARTITV